MIVLTRTPVQRIINCSEGPDASSQWEGRHTRFALYDELPAAVADNAGRKKWHCGTGHTRIAHMNYKSALQNNSAYIGVGDEGELTRNGRPKQRTKLFYAFKKNAKQGDHIYLHNGTGSKPGRVTHWGVYTGEILSHAEGCNPPPLGSDPSGWASEGHDTVRRNRPRWRHIKVKKWIEVREPFPMKKRIDTLFEVTDEPTYTH
jgi:hypothetical protein